MKKNLLIILLCLLVNTFAFTQSETTVGQDFWIAFPPNYDSSPELKIFISTESETEVSGTVKSSSLSIDETFTVTPGSVTQITIPSEAALAVGIENKGIHIKSDGAIAVYGLNRISATTDAFLAMPNTSLGLDYRVMTYKTTIGTLSSAFGVVATADGTTLTIYNAETDVTSTVSLNEGQTYYVEAPSQNEDLTGSRIQANKPIAVYGSVECVNVPSGCSACDHIVEQMLPISSWGVDFVTIATAGRDASGDIFRILASEDNTEIRINGSLVSTIDAGEFYEVNLTGNNIIVTSKVALVAQFAKGINCTGGITGDPFMMIIPPREQFLTNYTISTVAGFVSHYINIIASSKALGTIKLDGVLIPTGSFAQVGSSSFYGAQIAITEGSHTLKSPVPFGAFVYGWTNADSYGYPGGGSLSPLGIVDHISISPTMASKELDKDYVCFNATVSDFYNDPVEGVLVSFAVNGITDKEGEAYTNASGVAEFCYSQTGSIAGTDSVFAQIIGISTDTAIVNWSVKGGNLSPTISGIASHAVNICNTAVPSTAEFTVTDAETPATNLTVTGISSNTAIIPNENITFGGSGNNRTITITPQAAVYGETQITVTVQDGGGAAASSSFTLTVNNGDNDPPIAIVIPDLIANCSATPATPTTIDECAGIITGTTTTVFPITAEGKTIVEWKFDDGSDNSITVNQNVILYLDVTAPVTPSIADVYGCSSVTPSAPTTTDDCSGIITGTTTTTFPIETPGTTVVTWTFDDGNGHSTTANQNVIVGVASDPPIAPVLSDVAEECSATPPTPTTMDACSGEITGTTTTTFPITTLGTTVVTWSFDDGAGNISTADQNVTVNADATPPKKPVLPDVRGCTSVTPVAPTAIDACAGTITGTTATIFPITSLGTTIVTWSFNDGNGNTSTANQNVILVDGEVTPPVTPVIADASGECSVTPEVPFTTDACAVDTIYGTTTTEFPITSIGTTIVTWTFTDLNSNTTTANQLVTVSADHSVPVVSTLSDVTGECSVTPDIPTATDACAGTITGTTTSEFPITSLGTTVVTWTFDDGNGNITTANQNIIVGADNTPPVTPTLADATGICSVTPDSPTTTDACAGTITGTTTTEFPVTTKGTTIVTWTFDDGSGNTTTADQNVIITDAVDPTFNCPTDIVTCDGTIPSIAPTNVLDNCTVPVVTYELTGATIKSGTGDASNETFNPGVTTVTYTFDDGNGNIGECSFDLTYESVDLTVTKVDNTLTANASGTYKWINCATNTIIDGQTAKSFTPSASGEYAVIVSGDECSDTSDCYEINITGISNSDFGSEISVYPSPVTDFVNIDLGRKYNNVTLVLLNISGQKVSRAVYNDKRLLEVDMHDLKSGIYFIQININEKSALLKIVKQ